LLKAVCQRTELAFSANREEQGRGEDVYYPPVEIGVFFGVFMSGRFRNLVVRVVEYSFSWVDSRLRLGYNVYTQ
jgi:hypothetical protein